MRRWLINGLALAALWLFIRGVPAEPQRLLGEGLIGLGIGVPIAYASRRFYGSTTDLDSLLRIPYAVLYLLAFVKELILANITVARIVLSPSLPIRPAVVEIPLRVRSDLAITAIANSITLTPGTLTMDYDRDRNALYVHSINATDPEAVTDPIRTWEDYALRVFDEEATPDDPAPEPSVGTESEGDQDG